AQRLYALLRRVVVEVARVEVIATADVGDQSAAGLDVGVAVDVDEPGNDELAAGVDATIDGAGEGPSDERDAGGLKHEHTATQQPEHAVSIGDDVAFLDQGLHGCLLGLALNPRSRSRAMGTRGARRATLRRRGGWPSPRAAPWS